MQAPDVVLPASVTKLEDGRVHTLIVGAGPSGLATAHKLVDAGIVPLIVERSRVAGGLMRSITRGDFIMDIGRKELYTRIPEVDRFWRDLLRSDYRAYPHRVGSLYRGRVLELSSKYRGPLRGLPWHWLMLGGLDLIRCWLGTRLSKPKSYQDYWYRRAGRRFALLFAQGYWEKFRGQAWADMPVPVTEIDGSGVSSYSLNVIRQGLKLASQGGPSTQMDWRHPARGSGQIADLMLGQLRHKGVQIAFETEVTSMKMSDGQVAEVTTRSPTGS
jgi:protoporphyrinogen oxidase